MRKFSEASKRNPYRNPQKRTVEKSSVKEEPKKLRTENVVVFVDNIPTVILEVDEENTIEDLKHTLEKYMGTREEMDVFLNREQKLDVDDKYDKAKLGPVWSYMDSPSIFLNHRSYPVKPVYGYPNPEYEEVFYSNNSETGISGRTSRKGEFF